LNYSHNIQQLTDISYLVSVVLENEDALELKSEFDRDLIKNSTVEGFRKGKAPLHVVIVKYGKDEYYKDMREYIAQKAFEGVTKNDERINPVIKPTYDFADWEEGGRFVFTATVLNQPPDPSDMFISPDTGLPEQASRTTFNKPIPGLQGQMPMIDGKPPSHLAGNVPQPVFQK